MSDLNKIFQKVIEIDERKNNSLSNVTKSLMDLEIGEMARQAAERDMFPERDDLTPVNMSNENFAEKTFDNDVNAGLKLLASGYTPEEAFYDLEIVSSSGDAATVTRLIQGKIKLSKEERVADLIREATKKHADKINKISKHNRRMS